MSKTNTEKFNELFSGFKHAHGIYNITDTKPSGKVSGNAASINREVTLSLWDKHLKGKQGLGIVPITENNECNFAAIDIDDYDVDLQELNKKLQVKKIPVILCTTKSGGAHLYVFFKTPVPAYVVRDKLSEISAALGYGSSEIFPKQTEILAERGDSGNWINMPYMGGDNTLRYALSAKGQKLSVKEFLDYADIKKLNREDLVKIKLTPEEVLHGGPPCLQQLCQAGFPEGTRNSGLFSLGVYAAKRDPDGWKKLLDKLNRDFMDPPLSSNEVLGVVKSLTKKEYNYNCGAEPIKSFCNKAKCRGCKYGIGQMSGMPTFGTLTKLATDPPIWFLTVDDGSRLELTTDDLQNPLRFQKSCMEKLNVMPPVLKRENWQETVRKLLEEVHVIDVPKDTTPQGQLMEHVEEFCCRQGPEEREPDILLLGQVWNYRGHHHFRLKDLFAFLDRQRFTDLPKNRITMILKDNKGSTKFLNVKGKGVNVFKIPMFNNTEEPLSNPAINTDEPF